MKIRIKKEMVSKVIFLKDGKVLILERSFFSSVRSPWKWDLPGGHMEEGEIPEETAVREVREEIDLIPTSLHKFSEGTSIGKKTHFFVCRSWTGEIKLSDEHKSFKWVPLKALPIYRDPIGKMYYNAILKALEK